MKPNTETLSDLIDASKSRIDYLKNEYQKEKTDKEIKDVVFGHLQEAKCNLMFLKQLFGGGYMFKREESNEQIQNRRQS